MNPRLAFLCEFFVTSALRVGQLLEFIKKKDTFTLTNKDYRPEMMEYRPTIRLDLKLDKININTIKKVLDARNVYRSITSEVV